MRERGTFHKAQLLRIAQYFEAEIVGKHHTFVTGKWDADEATDRDHWSKFSTFGRYQVIVPSGISLGIFPLLAPDFDAVHNLFLPV
jgi:hypothetical protein